MSEQPTDTALDRAAAPDAPGAERICAIAAGTRFEGLLSFWGAARVDGNLRGEVASRGTLDVGRDAHIEGRVEVDTLIIAGRVEGQIFARERVDVLPGAHVSASIRTPLLAVAEGAHFEGRLDMDRTGATGASAASVA